MPRKNEPFRQFSYICRCQRPKFYHLSIIYVNDCRCLIFILDYKKVKKLRICSRVCDSHISLKWEREFVMLDTKLPTMYWSNPTPYTKLEKCAFSKHSYFQRHWINIQTPKGRWHSFLSKKFGGENDVSNQPLGCITSVLYLLDFTQGSVSLVYFFYNKLNSRSTKPEHQNFWKNIHFSLITIFIFYKYIVHVHA